MSTATAEPPAPGAAALFLAFARVGLQGFGGVLPFVRRELVDRQGWMTEEGFLDTLALCQPMPGPNIVNLSGVVGFRFAGPVGAVAAMAGLIAAPFVIVLSLAVMYDRFLTEPHVAGAITGLKAAAAGLVVATVARLAKGLKRELVWRSLSLSVLVFAGVGLAHWPQILVMGLAAPLGVLVFWRR